MISGVALLLLGATLLHLDAVVERNRKWVSKRFGDISVDKIILADSSLPLFSSPGVCQYALVSLGDDAPVSPVSGFPDNNSGPWQPGPSPWGSDRSSDTSSLWSCRIMNVSQDAFDIAGDLADDTEVWWLVTGNGGYLYSTKRNLAFMFYFPD